MSGGWIKVYRQLQDHSLWRGERFTKGQAWVDLMLSASHADHEVMRDYGTLTVLRGQVLTSQLALSRRWGWHRESVSKFLLYLKSAGMTSTQTSNRTSTGYTLITILNYEKYQGSEDEDTDSQPDNGASTQTSTRPAVARQSPGTIKNGKKGKKNTSANGLPHGFAAWWDEYPKKVGKIQAVNAWEKLDPDEPLQVLVLDAIRKQKRTVKAMLENDRTHILDPERWIKYRRWEDEIPAMAASGIQYPAL
jgi:hypothetical protein